MGPEYPEPDQLADDQDQLGWDREKHGRMIDCASSPEDEPLTLPYEELET